MRFSDILLLSIYITQAIATDPVVLSAHSLTQDRSFKLGVLTFADGAPKVIEQIEELEIPQTDEEYCLGTEIDGGFQCHSLQTLNEPINFDLIVTTKPNGDLISYSFKKGRVGAKGIQPVVKASVSGAVPTLQKVKEVPVTTADGKTLVEEEEEPKSFIQKYWMFIVPALLLFVTSGGSS